MPVISVRDAVVIEPAQYTRDLQFRITLDTPATEAVTIRYETVDGTASTMVDFLHGFPNEISIAAGTREAVLAIPIKPDGITEGVEHFSLVLTSATNASFAGGAAALTVRGYITEGGSVTLGDAQPIAGPTPAPGAGALPTVEVRDTAVFEGEPHWSVVAPFLVTLDKVATAPVTIAYHLVDINAASESGYLDGKSGTVTIAAGQQSAFILESVDGVPAGEATRRLQLVLDSVSGGVFADNAAYLTANGTVLSRDGTEDQAAGIGGVSTKVSGPASASATLPTLEVRDVTVHEGERFGEAAYFQVVLDRPPTAQVTFSYYLQDRSASGHAHDYEGRSGTVSFAAGQQSGFISIPLTADALIEGTEQFDLVLTGLSGAVFTGNAAALVATATIIDGDDGVRGQLAGIGATADQIMGPASASATLPTMRVHDVSMAEPARDRGQMHFLVTFDRVLTVPVTFQAMTLDGTARQGPYNDYFTQRLSGTIPAGVSSWSIAVEYRGDEQIEAEETLKLVVSNVNGAVLENKAAAVVATGTILDDDGEPMGTAGIGAPGSAIHGADAGADLPTLSVVSTSVAVGAFFSQTAVYVLLSRPADHDITVRYETLEGSAQANDFRAASGTLTIGSGQTSSYVYLGVNGSIAVEDDESFSVRFSNLSGAVFADGGDRATASVLIRGYDGSVGQSMGPDFNRFLGSDAADLINGSAGADTLHGLGGVDTIHGRDGDDLILGGAGADMLTGDAGADTFRGTRAELAGDVVTDLAFGDRIHVIDGDAGLYVAQVGTRVTMGAEVLTVATGGAVRLGARQAADGGIELLVGRRIADHDFNGDGASDILWRNGNGFLTTWWSTGAAFNGASGVGETISADWKVAGNGDFNGDGVSDILWRNDNGALTDWHGTGTGFDGATGVFLFVGTEWKVAGVGDITGDGRDDIVWRSDAGAMTVWRASDAGFDGASGYAYALDPAWKIAGLGDFDGNGQDDVLWRNDNGLTTTWSAVGGGFVASTVTLPVGAEWKAAGVADFNGDGRDDILWRNDAGTITDWYATAGGGFTPNGFATTLSNAWQVEGTGDYNGDGRADILFRNADGQVAAWLSQGDGFVPNPSVNAVVPADWLITV